MAGRLPDTAPRGISMFGKARNVGTALPLASQRTLPGDRISIPRAIHSFSLIRVNKAFPYYG